MKKFAELDGVRELTSIEVYEVSGGDGDGDGNDDPPPPPQIPTKVGGKDVSDFSPPNSLPQWE